MNYQQALDYIHGTHKFGSVLGLDNILYLLNLMGNPHKDLKVIHVAGTNGKGSTSSYIYTLLMEQGYRVGLYTSPYLEEFTERIRINNENIPKEELAEITVFVKSKIEQMLEDGKKHPTEFEVVTAIGFEYFKRQKVDFLVLEVGLGGRGDSTNVIAQPLVSVITPIDYDHIDYLGDTLKKIAYEKAGIIKKNCPVVSYPQQQEAMEIIEQVCTNQQSMLMKAPVDDITIISQGIEGQCFHSLYGSEALENLCIRMLGKHQIQNAVVALTALYVLEKEQGVALSKEAIYRGMRNTSWPGRLEIMGKEPMILIDGAHNVHGLKALANMIDQLFQDKKIILAMGILADKDISAMLEVIVPKADKLVLTKPNNPRAMAPDKLEVLIKPFEKPTVVKEQISEAVAEALSWADKEDVVIFCGSLYMIGEVRSILKNRR